MSRALEYQLRLSAALNGVTRTNYGLIHAIPWKRIALFSDVHAPYDDVELLAQAFENCELAHIEAIVWLGDLADGHFWSHWGVTEHNLNVDTEHNMIKTIVEEGFKAVNHQYWTEGNHDRRMKAKLDYRTTQADLARLCRLGKWLGDDVPEDEWFEGLDDKRLFALDNPTISAFDGRWKFTHPGVYSAQPLAQARKFSAKWECSVATGHSHQFAMGRSVNNKYTVLETGGFFNTDFIEYIHAKPMPGQEMSQGYWFIIDGQPIGFQKGDSIRRLWALGNLSA
ncbi:metallophosphoesterase [Ktedonospora formicarum]|uniref:Calcineurin-like phosphoesterase domain-containing protein n=1 Tax=Ktedonospora formicarum TaxID=2778364 RepID=A0A8J3I1X1_9CHLR|nr:metallophosphoesterase [Ktedonospora formicarum]GHO44553.1 hypothetical protein KSX_27160 [Ktedonospora formicarum]